MQDINLSIYISKERSLVKCSRKYTRATHITGSTGILLRRFFANNERKDSPTSYIATNIMASFHFLLSNNVTWKLMRYHSVILACASVINVEPLVLN